MTPKKPAKKEAVKPQQPQSDLLKDEHMESEEAEAHMRDLAEANRKKIKELHHNKEESGPLQEIIHLRAVVMKQLKKDLSYNAAITLYLDNILITISKYDFEHKAAQITQNVQQIINTEFPNDCERLWVIIQGCDTPKDKVIRMSKLK